MCLQDIMISKYANVFREKVDVDLSTGLFTIRANPRRIWIAWMDDLNQTGQSVVFPTIVGSRAFKLSPAEYPITGDLFSGNTAISADYSVDMLVKPRTSRLTVQEYPGIVAQEFFIVAFGGTTSLFYTEVCIPEWMEKYIDELAEEYQS